MSTSPSWFDQEKFSRLVKKVGTTTRSAGAQPASTLPASSPSAPTSTGPVQLTPAVAPAPAAATPEPAAPAPPAAETPSRPPASAIPKPAASLPLFTYKSATPAEAAPKTTPAPAAKSPEMAPAETPGPPLSAKAPEPAPEEVPTPEPPPSEPAPVARVFLTPPPAEISAPAPDSEIKEEEKPEVALEIPKAEPEVKVEEKPKLEPRPKFSFGLSKALPKIESKPEPESEPEPEPEAEPEAKLEAKPKFTFEIPQSELPAKPLPPALLTEKIKSAADFRVVEQPHIAKKPVQATTSTLQRLPRIMPGGAKPPAPPTQTRSVSALARRTTSLPGVKPLTAPLQPVERTDDPIRASDASEPPALPPPLELAPKAPPTSLSGSLRQTKSLTKHEATSDVWDIPPAEPGETATSKEQIARLNLELEKLSAKVGELSLAAQERDEARDEIATLRDQLAATETTEAAALSSNEVVLVTGERDAARRDYAELRQQYETLKQDQLLLKNEHAAAIADLRKQLEIAREQAAGHEQEIAAKGSASGKDDVIETLKQELKNLHEEVAKAKEEASTAQRGLALSQKALQETRDALREASEGKGALEGLKKERGTLVQQNMLLQAQNDQVSRELSALKAKLSSK